MDEQSRNPNRRLTLRRQHRLSGMRTFQRVRREGRRASSGPMTVIGAPNGLPESRLGLAIPRRVGKATTRNQIKRRLREAFRLLRREMPAGYDLIVQVRPHRPMDFEAYRQYLAWCWRRMDEQWRRRDSNNPKLMTKERRT